MNSPDDETVHFLRYAQPFADPSVKWRDAKPVAERLVAAGASGRAAVLYSRVSVFEARQSKADYNASKSEIVPETGRRAGDVGRLLVKFEREFGAYHVGNTLCAATARSLSVLAQSERSEDIVTQYLNETPGRELADLLASVRRLRQALSLVDRSHRVRRGKLGAEVSSRLLSMLATFYAEATGKDPTVTTNAFALMGEPRIAGRFAAYARATVAAVGETDMISDHHIKTASAKWRKGDK